MGSGHISMGMKSEGKVFDSPVYEGVEKTTSARLLIIRLRHVDSILLRSGAGRLN